MDGPRLLRGRDQTELQVGASLHSKPEGQTAGQTQEAVPHHYGQRVETIYQMFPRLEPHENRAKVILFHLQQLDARIK